MSPTVKRDFQGCLIAPAVTAEQIKSYRKELGLTQEEFAAEFKIPLGTLRDWEQAARNSRTSQLFATLIPKLSRAGDRGPGTPSVT